MKALQLLKFSLKKEHLDFTAGWSTSEAEMSGGSGPSCDILANLLEGNEDIVLDVILKDLLTDDEYK